MLAGTPRIAGDEAAAVIMGATVDGGTVGSVLFVGAGSVLAQDNSKLFWDDTNNRLGVGTATPSYTLHVSGGTLGIDSGSGTDTLRIRDANITKASGSGFQFTSVINTTPGTVSAPGLGFSTDSNTGIYSVSADVLGFTTGGVARMAIDAAGLVGIGTSSQTEKLEVFGSGDVVTKIYAQGARVDANTPSPRLYFNKDITSGTVAANDVAGIILVNSDDASNNLGNSHQILFQTSGVTAGAVTTDIIFQTVQGASIGTLATAMTIQGGLVGIGTSAPTHALTMPASSTGIATYNTADQTTNYERFEAVWASNVLNIGTRFGGSGTGRSLAIGVGSTPGGTVVTGRSLVMAVSPPFYTFSFSTGTSGNFVQLSGTISASSSTQVPHAIVPTVSQTGTAGYTALLINPTESSLGSGVNRLISAQIGGTDKFVVTNTGAVTIAAGSATAGTAPLKLTSGTLLTVAEAGAVEYLTDAYYVTTTTGAVRRMLHAGSTGRATAQVAAVATVATYTLGASDATFLVSANILVTTATNHAFTATVAYTDEGNTARTLTLMFTLVAGGTLVTSVANANGTVPYMGVPQHIRCKASTAITIATTGTFTTVTYNVEGNITQIA